MIKEIGSEFWCPDLQKTESLNIKQHHRFLLAGRTAIDHIIKDIKAYKKIQTAYLPSYCCHTMIKPFIDNEIRIQFYQVSFKNGQFDYDIDFNISSDIFFAMKYFGFDNKAMDEYIENFKDKDVLIIEDATHSWFSEKSFNDNSDYAFVSFRKWTGLAAGSLIIKNHDDFFIPEPDKTNEKYIELRQKAYSLKSQYINENFKCNESRASSITSKNNFLEIFKQAEALIENDYHDYCLPKELINSIKSINTSFFKQRRRENAKYLIDNLSEITQLDIPRITETDTPLFVPIFLSKYKRDELYRHLIENHIYCPIHWPVLDFEFEYINALYNTELSLICDQRYDKEILYLLILKLKEFFNE